MTIDRRTLLGAAPLGLVFGLAPGRAAARAPTFRIGALNPVTGAGSPYGTGMQRMILAAVEEVNAAGGAGGCRLEVFAEDSQTQPQAAVLAAKKLIEVNNVRAIVGTWSSGVSLAVIPLTNDANIILMNTSGAPALSVPPANAKGLSYRFQATNDRFGRAFYAHYIGYVVPDQFVPLVTFYVWMAIIMGRVGRISGAVVGTVLLMLFLEGSRFLRDAAPFISAVDMASVRIGAVGLALILFTMYRPQGRMGDYTRR